MPSNEDLLKIMTTLSIVVLKFVALAVVPVLGFFWLILYAFRVGSTFQQLVFTLGLVYILGGFYVLGVKALELLSRTRQIQATRFEGFSSLTSTIRLDLQESLSPDQIESLWLYISHNVGIDELQTSYNDSVISQEVIIRNKQVEWYLSMPKTLAQKVISFLHTQAPQVKVSMVEDPFLHWPKEWDRQVGLGPYSDFYACSYELGGNNLYPLVDPQNLPNNDTIVDLSSQLIKLDKEMTVVLQMVLSPATSESLSQTWQKEIIHLQETAANADKSNVKNISSQEQQTKQLLEILQDKVFRSHWQTHLRATVFYPAGRKSEITLLDKYINDWSAQLSTSYQHFSKIKSSATNYLDSSKVLGPLSKLAFPLIETFYTPKQLSRKEKIQYWGLLHRSLEIPINTSASILDVCSLASLSYILPKPKPSFSIHLPKSRELSDSEMSLQERLRAKLLELKSQNQLIKQKS